MTVTPPSLPGEQAKKPTFKPILITLLCSLLLAGGSCFAALQTFNYNRGGGTLWGIFMVIFLAAALSFIVACAWLIARAVRMTIQKRG